MFLSDKTYKQCGFWGLYIYNKYKNTLWRGLYVQNVFLFFVQKATITLALLTAERKFNIIYPYICN